MRSAKVRKMDRKAKHKAQAVAQTAKSRQRRLDNKAKRAEIHAIDPDIKVKVIDQVTYDEDGNKITVYDNSLSITSSTLKTSEDFDQKLQDRIEEVEAVIGTVDSESKFKKIINKWRL